MNNLNTMMGHKGGSSGGASSSCCVLEAQINSLVNNVSIHNYIGTKIIKYWAFELVVILQLAYLCSV